MPEKSRAGLFHLPATLLVLAFFIVSGACGLVYQVVWTRQLVLLFGSTSYAVSTVLSVFFLGLGVGAWAGGRLADRVRNPLLFYAIAEFLIAGWALAVMVLIQRGEAWAVPVLQSLHEMRGAGLALRMLLCTALLLPPCLLMGATLPFLAKFVNREPRVQGIKIGLLYTFNTLGAVVGCYYAGFQLLPALGYSQSTAYAATGNTAVGVLALLLALVVRGGSADEEQSAQHDTVAPPRHTVRLVLAAYALSGFCALALEVLWTRLLVIAFLGTTYAYTTMLSVLLSGLVIGGGVGSVLVRLRAPTTAWLGMAMGLCGVAVVYLLSSIAGIPNALQDYGNGWNETVRATFQLSAWALLPASILFGITFPFAIALLGSARATLGRDLGLMYGLNTLGGVLGALAGGYAIIPLLGTHHGILMLGALLLLGALALVVASPLTGKARIALVATLLVAFGGAAAVAPRDVMEALNAGYVPTDNALIHFAEHTEGTVAVSEPKKSTSESDRVLWINRVQATASIQKGVRMNRFQGALPLLYTRMPEDVLFMCFGSGVTCGTLALSDFRSIDAVEINPGVLEAAHYFKQDNLDVLRRPNVHAHIDDGRNFLLTSQKKYDLITFEPMPLALAGVSAFYTEEYYRLCLERLNPGGIVSQWIPLHSLGADIVEGLAHTFHAAFPHCMVWFINADLFLIGSNEPLQLDFEAARARLEQPELQAALAAVGFQDPYEIFASFLMSDAALRDWADGGEILRDDRPWAEFEAPKMVYSAKVPDALAKLSPHMLSPGAFFAPGTISDEDLARVEQRHLSHRNDILALQDFYKGFAIDISAADKFIASLDIDPENNNAKFYLRQLLEKQIEAFLQWEEYDKLEALVARAIIYLPEDPMLPLALGDLYTAKGQPERAQPEFRRYLELGGTEQRARDAER